MKFISIVIVLCLLLLSCSGSKDTIPEVRVDPTIASRFANRISQRYADYALASGYKHFKDSVDNYRKEHGTRGPCGIITPGILFRSYSSQHDIVLYTFDMKDTCAFTFDTLANEIYFLPLPSIPIPTGSYLVKSGDSLACIDQP